MRVINYLLRRESPATTKSQIPLTFSKSQFLDLLRRERLRSDRSQSPFTLLHARPTAEVSGSEGREALAAFIRGAAERIRETDIAGPYGDGVGLILIDTDLDGAETVLRAIDNGDCRLEFELMVYPEGEHTQDDDRELVGADCQPSQAQVSGAEERVDSLAARLHPRVKTTSLLSQFAVSIPTWKRGLDLLAAGLGLIVLFPLLAAVACAIKCVSPGPALFSQRRTGRGGKPFTLYKFRTMHVNAEAMRAELMALNEQDGPAFKITDDPRVFSLGRILRKTCIDELPQLWNVLLGDMSLVGPRPLPCEETKQSEQWTRRRYDVTPGLTCTWQVEGSLRVTFTEWMRMDLRYIRGQRLWLDLTLIGRTIGEVLLARASR